MNKFIRIILIAAVVVFVVVLIIFTREKPPIDSQPPAEAAATIFPIYDIARNIGGDAVQVELILSPGDSPHTFDPTPGTVRKVQDTQVVFAIGHGLDEWAADLAEISGAEVKVVSEGIELREIDEDHAGHADDHNHGDLDPHYWLDLDNGRIIAQNIADDLSVRFPERSDEIASNLEVYLKELDAAQLQIESLREQIDNNKIVTLHDAWYYFATDNGLEIAGTFEPAPGREPTPQSLAGLSSLVAEAGSSVIYSEPQLSNTSIISFANDNDLLIVGLDPLGGVEGRESYIDLLIYNVQEVAENQ